VIRLLDEATIGQIAAGEVVERPMSVVKELVENALDAGARVVRVAVARGGSDSIEVRDDGVGIEPEDLPLALRRHATSKLEDASSLERVTTLGFRGEGLASIAAVARVRIVSRTAGCDVGFGIDASGESIGCPEPVAAPPGTQVEVRDLFANVPVRREFLRSPSAEFARISAFLSTIALAYPDVRFSLAHDGRDVWAFPAAATLEERLAHVFGHAAARELVALETTPIVRGFISRPGWDRPDRRLQVAFVNGRLLRSPFLNGAWTAGYATFAMSGRQPYGVLFVTLAPERVDPNVHPTKSDVRLRDATAVSDAVRRAIAATLRRHAGAEASTLSFAPPRAPFDAEAAGAPEVLPLPGADVPPASGNGAGELRVLAQLDGTFILATDGQALVLVDQHAAHERIAFEAIARRGREVRGEPLLVPYSIEVDGARWERFESARASLTEAGLEVEPFGERTYRVVATPAGYGARAFDVRGFLDDLSDDVPGLDARERIWASLACHSVVRAGETLEYEEMVALIRRLVRSENPMHCPHGRPTIVRVEADSIARLFKRT
jgi:DNA mismatch repair protein MutL